MHAALILNDNLNGGGFRPYWWRTRNRMRRKNHPMLPDEREALEEMVRAFEEIHNELAIADLRERLKSREEQIVYFRGMLYEPKAYGDFWKQWDAFRKEQDELAILLMLMDFDNN